MKMSMMLIGAMVGLVSASGALASECVDGRAVRLRCVPGAVLTGFDCAEAYEIRCAQLEELPLVRRSVKYFFPAQFRDDLSVSRDGVVTRVRVTRTGRQVLHRSRATVGEMARLGSAVAQLEPGALTHPDLNRHPCMDAPTTEVDAVKSNGTSVRIFERVACRPSRLEQPAARVVMRVLTEIAERIEGTR